MMTIRLHLLILPRYKRRSLPFKGRVGVGMGWDLGGNVASRIDPTPIPTFPLKGKEFSW